MRWRQPAHAPLATAIVASFRESPDRAERLLRAFSPAEWQKTWFWLDASGLTLYFLEHAETAGFLDAVDAATVQRLRQKLIDNTERTQDLFREFSALNRAFLRERVLFANLKGFTLCPDSCPRPELRLQLDFDFLVSGRYLVTCQSVLEKLGYELAAVTPTSWEFKANHHVSTRITDPYKRSAFRSVELHFNLDNMNRKLIAHDERLDRLTVWHYDGCSVPALCPADQLISQALHILGHLRSASTRPAWLLEFQRHVLAYRYDMEMWREVRQRAHGNTLVPIAMGVCVLLATELFGEFAPPPLRDWAEPAVPDGVRRWLDRYGQRAVLADFPGTKLYLLLERELSNVIGQPATRERRGILPRPRIPRLYRDRPGDSFATRARRMWMQLRFVLFRTRFHIVEGLRYAIEAMRWPRRLRSSSPHPANVHTLSLH